MGFLDARQHTMETVASYPAWIWISTLIQTDRDSHVLQLQLHRGLCNCTLPGAPDGPCTHCKAELCLTWTILELPSSVKHQPIHLFHLPYLSCYLVCLCTPTTHSVSGLCLCPWTCTSAVLT